MKKNTLALSVRPILLSFIALSPFLLASVSYSGTNCGSDTSGLARLHKGTTSDWWPDLATSLVADVVVPSAGVFTFTAAFCATTQGQANFGDACFWHDACYEGREGLGMTREECDMAVRSQWKQSCENKYKPANSFDVGQKFCQDYCKNTADGMYDLLSPNSQTAWDEARNVRDGNIAAAINAIYMEIYGRKATADETSASKNYLASTKSVDGLKAKVKQDYATLSTSTAINTIMNILLE